MLDFGFDKIALIGAVALIVIGPEKLPRVARTVGTLLGKAQRYVSDVKAEVNRSIELEELQKMKTQFQSAVQDVEQSVRQEVDSATQAFDQSWRDVTSDSSYESTSLAAPPPEYRHPKKNWRLKRGATPMWFKQKAGVKRHTQSGAARVARFRPPGIHR
ncbi:MULTISPECIES: Sec-independent protein translocase protein TatB [unclassified Roseateles]|uniref:Sec-independent protein translocase protein TatB n=1 Tax=unclassified Roseateles TaxID=2626991 RepID=UPI0006F8FE22|nr:MULTISPECIES: Sec-independent protein translocase protein TatB [unclassified Roseateles]KQW42800.1 preprotein translocase [Pelomonas sp. Root405]KRA69478.1 preprotein translocase [Pelomonas sp. Root662]